MELDCTLQTNFFLFTSDPCNGRMTDPFGAFSSVDRDGNGHYDANLNCTWLIIAEGNKALQLKIISLDIEVSKGCTNDYLQVNMKLTISNQILALISYVSNKCSKLVGLKNVHI